MFGDIMDTQQGTTVNSINWLNYLFLVMQLAFIVFVVQRFAIENSAFLTIISMLSGGFMVHYFIPMQHRMLSFALLSMAGSAVILGWLAALWIFAIVALVLLISTLRISFTLKLGLIISGSAVLALFRADLLPFAGPETIWPILGSMLMFRLITYLYDLKHAKVQPTISQSLAYFFMLPNVVFPLFPVVDFTNFSRSHYNIERHKIYQVGIDWITRGIIHLLLYRLVYYYMAISPADVATPVDLLQYLSSNFLLYLRVSGLFHIIVGCLHLFGFNLQETHHLYYLSSSFTDFWRRINIYWKDFMMKVFYYPIFFRLKGLGMMPAVVLSTLVVFFLTIIFHSYQWFWLRGQFPVIWQDMVFWGVLGALVIINSLWELKKGKGKNLAAKNWSLANSCIYSLKVLLTFTCICILWSLWSAQSWSGWLAMFTVLKQVTAADLAVNLALLLGYLVAGFALQLWSRKRISGGNYKAATERRPYTTVALLVVMSVFSLSQVYTSMGPDVANTIATMRSGKLSKIDTQALERGYYEELVRVNRFNSQLWEVYMKKPSKWLQTPGADLKYYTGDFIQYELLKSTRSSTEYGVMTTNQWGMRDREYELVAKPDTLRIALLGSSIVTGWGVGDDETFESMLEQRLNQQLVQGAKTGAHNKQHIEILNLSAPGYMPLQQLPALEKALKFKPDLVYYAATAREMARAAFYLQDLVRREITIPYPALKHIAQRAKLNADMEESVAVKALQPYREEILSWLYTELAAQASALGTKLVWFLIPQIEVGNWQNSIAKTQEIAKQAGFTQIDLLNVYQDHQAKELVLTTWDKHPNKLGHRLLSNSLFQAINKSPDKYLLINNY
jgi:D-alanyl-lipoteichoic acid acyltransferase DltB (MBOAT superfamily)